MMNEIEFAIYGNPVAEGRPRAFVPKGRTKPIVHTPPKSKEWKRHIKREAIQAMQGREKLITGSVALTLHFFMLRPKHHHGARGLRPSAPKHHLTTPDLDNCIKAIIDGLTGIVFRDDKQICNISASKEYGDRPGVQVKIIESP